MAGTDPGGSRPIQSGAPDGKPFDEQNYPYNWSQGDRERGTIRHAPGGRSFETAIAVVGGDGQALAGKSLQRSIEDLIFVVERLRMGMVQAGFAENIENFNDLELPRG